MSENITLGHINKRVNSTREPDWNSMSVGNFDVTLKDGSSLLNPVFELSTNKSFNSLSRCNYLEWHSDVQTDQKHNYYWIDEIVSDYDGYFTIHCHRDPLATFKGTITNYQGIIARLSNTYREEIRDTELMASSQIVERHDAFYDVYEGASEDQGTTPALGQSKISATWEVIGKDGCQIFNIRDTVQNTMHDLINGGYTFEQGVTNPGQYVKSCKILPIGADSYTQSARIQVGNLDQVIGSPYYVVNPASITNSNKNLYFKIPKDGALGFKQYLHYGKDSNKLDFRNYTASFTSVKIWAPLVGSIDFPAQHLHCDYILGEYAISLANGAGKFMLKAVYEDSGNMYREVIIMTSNINTAIDVAIAEGHTNALNITNDICDAIATVSSDIGAAVTAGAQASSGGAGGGIGAVSSIGNAVANTGKTGMSIAADFASGFQEYTCLGNSGSLVDLMDNFIEPRFTIYQYGTVIDSGLSAEKGRAQMQVGTITASERFVVMYAPSLAPDGATLAEINEINATLASGIYIE